jgi:dTDP-4-dehydrorhamnose reductase
LPSGGSVGGTSTTGAGGWSPLDITDRSAVLALVSSVRPAVIVNAASRYGDWAVCADGAAHVALAAAAVGARLIHVSSDALHGGRRAADVRLDSSRAASLLKTRPRAASECI